MGRHYYTSEQLEFLAANVKGLSHQELTNMFNTRFNLQLQVGKIASVLSRHNLGNGIKSRLFYQEHIDFLTANVKGRSSQELTDMFNAHFSTQLQVNQITEVLKYYKLRSGSESRFRPGHTPFYKGIYTQEQLEFLTANMADYSRPKLVDMFNAHFNTQLRVSQINSLMHHRELRSGRRFGGSSKNGVKKRQIFWNSRPAGAEKNHGHGYIYVKVAEPDKWRAKHVLIWEAANGPVPKDCVVIFGDRNKQNFELENLVLVSRRELGLMNRKGLIQNSAELTRIGVTIADIYLKITERQKQFKVRRKLQEAAK